MLYARGNQRKYKPEMIHSGIHYADNNNKYFDGYELTSMCSKNDRQTK